MNAFIVINFPSGITSCLNQCHSQHNHHVHYHYSHWIHYVYMRIFDFLLSAKAGGFHVNHILVCQTKTHMATV